MYDLPTHEHAVSIDSYIVVIIVVVLILAVDILRHCRHERHWPPSLSPGR